MALLEALPTANIAGTVIATHACLDHPTAHIEDAYEAEIQLALCEENFLLVGHSHRPFAFVEGVGWIDDPLAVDRIELSDRAVLCPGSIAETPGAPASCCILDTERQTCSWHVVSKETPAARPRPLHVSTG